MGVQPGRQNQCTSVVIGVDPARASQDLSDLRLDEFELRPCSILSILYICASGESKARIFNEIAGH